MSGLRWRVSVALVLLALLAAAAWAIAREQGNGRRADAARAEAAQRSPQLRARAQARAGAQARASSQRTDELDDLQLLALGATLLVLTATALLVLRPLLRRTAREIDFVRLLHDVAVAANEATSERDALERALRLICRVLRWPLGHALLLDRATGALVATGIWHVDAPERSEEFRAASNGLRFPRGHGLPGRAMRDRSPAWSRGVAGEADLPRAGHASRAGIRVAAAMPLLVRKEVVGVLEFFSHRARAPDQELLDVMSQVGTQLGRVIERHRAEERLAHQAGHDALTGLPNRNLLDDRLRMASARALRRGTPVALLFIDIDRFKPVNDTLGHAAGDELLQRVADRIREHVRSEDTVARVGGDEFVVLYDQVADSGDAHSRAKRLGMALCAPFPVAGQSVTVGASIGLALSDRGLGDAARMLAQADHAMYRAKQEGDGAVTVFDPDLDAEPVEQLAARRRLRLT